MPQIVVIWSLSKAHCLHIAKVDSNFSRQVLTEFVDVHLLFAEANLLEPLSGVVNAISHPWQLA